MSQYDDAYAELAHIAAQTKGLYTSDKYGVEGLPEFFVLFFVEVKRGILCIECDIQTRDIAV